MDELENPMMGMFDEGLDNAPIMEEGGIPGVDLGMMEMFNEPEPAPKKPTNFRYKYDSRKNKNKDDLEKFEIAQRIANELNTPILEQLFSQEGTLKEDTIVSEISGATITATKTTYKGKKKPIGKKIKKGGK